jgi:hypothetical protein
MYRGCVPGDAHSCCHAIRENASEPNDPKIMELEILLATHQCMLMVNDEPIVKLDECGIKNGWAGFPLNFDPVWLSDCKLFKEKID